MAVATDRSDPHLGKRGDGTAVAGAVTVNALTSTTGKITTESLSTATGAIYTLAITKRGITTDSIVLASVQLGGSTNGTPQIVDVKVTTDTITIRVKNIDSTNAFNGTLIVNFVHVN